MCEVAHELDEEAQLEYEEACNEVLELQAELRAEKMEVQQLMMRVQASQAASASFAQSAALPAVLEEPRAHELQHLFRWLADNVDLSHPRIFDVGFEVPIGGRTVHLHRVVQWPLPSVGLQLTAPSEHRVPLGHLLASTRSTGKVDVAALLHFLHGWDLIAGELTTAAHLSPEPSVLLSHRASTQGILIATWPTREAQVSPCSLRLGERVEVEYEGEKYLGILYSLDAYGMASIKCDADPPGVMTVTPLSRVKRVSTAECLPCTAQDVVGISVSAMTDIVDSVPGRQMHRRTRSSAL
ncbi:unnamed protein product [Effrenium voratum]|uniref:Uncharacterized protein n=1 Tax=Effrenium voratum TaxID=2562239 RepID=A0AA36MTF9_9DINO|nr:unnamed protein product [Effrenium voratum]CAJ1385260.1 unnamed protein product [Effrenium voratum]